MLPITLLSLFFSSITWAGRPVFQGVDLTGLTEQSDLIIAGWPSPHKQASPWGEPFGLWQINYVIKGDQTLRHKIIPVYAHGYHIYSGPAAQGNSDVSYAALKYGPTGVVHKEQRSTILFLKKEGEYWELTAAGAQEELAKEQLIRSIASPADCRAQTEAVRVALNTLPQDCTSNDECLGMNLHPRSCERPRAFNIKAEKMLPLEWPTLAARARTACAPQWSQEPACAPRSTDAYCKDNRCRLGTIPPSTLSFREVTLAESCAPHDAGSMYLAFTDGADKPFPRLIVNWWGTSQPSRKSGTYTLSNGFGGKATEGFSSSYCRSEGNCAMIKGIYVKVQLNDAGGGEAEIEGITFDGAPIRVKAPLKLLPMKKGLRCG